MNKLMPPKVPTKVRQTDYSKFSDEQIKAQLQQRGLSVKGSRAKLENRLKAEVQRAWAQYHKKNKNNPSTKKLFPKTKKPKKPKQTPEQIAAAQEAAKQRRQEKAKRRAEHMEKMEEAREAKRQKKEKAAELQAERMKKQKVEKTERQKLECFVSFDIKDFQEQLMKKVDPSGNTVSSMSFNAVNKRFNIRFKTAKQQVKFTKGSTMAKGKTFDLKMTMSALPSPVETRCVMFLYPSAANHPDADTAASWVESQGGEEQPDLSALKNWKDSAYKSFSKYGKIVNIYRERGFLVVQFSTDSEAKKMMSKSGDSFNGCQFVHKQIGTPTKQDKNTVLKEYPMPSLKKVKKEE